jgi:hypothetical protein
MSHCFQKQGRAKMENLTYVNMEIMCKNCEFGTITTDILRLMALGGVKTKDATWSYFFRFIAAQSAM